MNRYANERFQQIFYQYKKHGAKVVKHSPQSFTHEQLRTHFHVDDETSSVLCSYFPDVDFCVFKKTDLDDPLKRTYCLYMKKGKQVREVSYVFTSSSYRLSGLKYLAEDHKQRFAPFDEIVDVFSREIEEKKENRLFVLTH